MSVKTKVKKYYRKDKKGKIYKVSKHRRKKRKVGKKIRYTRVGEFFVAHDQYGNFKGSKVVKKKRKIKKKTVRKRRVPSRLDKIDTDYYTGIIDNKVWLSRRKKAMKLR